MEPVYRMRIGSHLSVASLVAKEDGARIYGFRRWGRMYWSGDGETLHAQKRAALEDARRTNPALAALRHHVTGAVERGEAAPVVCQPV